MDAIRRNMAGQFDEKELRGMDYESCVKELMTIKGVGEKVANCVSLFGLGKKEAFPVDVWIKRIMETVWIRRRIRLPHLQRNSLVSLADLRSSTCFIMEKQSKWV